ncbi:major facilitator superfamily domain-containing protein [Fusarium oxysporum Fo47]|uniref:major facilitator superfamily domain-containing protein n=1 Tax=Fusarium oxysporum Fo47 TaxID=660027 RepID=UPI002869C344|nr:major facilitator superfamily domain-containing protein [Fusarium oxysporum Fo47]WJG34376.1 major facilitator superfamily domain-containing protein [Fusarium oxysporum Fo47]
MGTVAEVGHGPSHQPWWKTSHLIKLNSIILSLVLFSSANGYDGGLMGSILALNTWNSFMQHPTGAYLGWMTAIYWLGNGLSTPLAAWCSNRYGRKPGLYAGYFFLIIGVGMQAGAPNEKAFTYARLFIGFAAGFLGNSAPVLINEIAYPSHRAIASALFMCGWYVGGTICGWVTFACRVIPNDWSWRIPVLLQIFLPLCALPGFLMAPESPRWYVSVGRLEEATDVIAKYHAGGNRDDPIVSTQMMEIEAAITAEKDAAKTCLNVWNLLWATAAAVSVDRLGRRFLFLTSASVMFLSFVVVTALSASFAKSGASSVGLAVVPFLFIFFAGYDVGLTPFLVAYPCEIWQFSLRSRGLTVAWCTTVASIFFNSFVNAIALDAIQWRYYIVFAVILFIFIFVVYFTYPETRGHTLEQMAVIFDGEDAVPSQAVALEKTDVEEKE